MKLIKMMSPFKKEKIEMMGLTIREKFLALFALLAIIFTTTAAISYNMMDESNDKWEGYLSNIAQRQKYLTEMWSALADGGGIHHFENLVFLGDLKHATNSKSSFQIVLNKIKKFRRLNNLSKIEEVNLKHIESLMIKYVKAIDIIIQLKESKKSTSSMGAKIKIDDSLTTKAFSILSMEQARLTSETNQSIHSSLLLSTPVTILSLIFSFFSIVLFCHFIRQDIIHSIHRLSQFAKQIRAGNLNGTLKTHVKDEFRISHVTCLTCN